MQDLQLGQRPLPLCGDAQQLEQEDPKLGLTGIRADLLLKLLQRIAKSSCANIVFCCSQSLATTA